MEKEPALREHSLPVPCPWCTTAVVLEPEGRREFLLPGLVDIELRVRWRWSGVCGRCGNRVATEIFEASEETRALRIRELKAIPTPAKAMRKDDV